MRERGRKKYRKNNTQKTYLCMNPIKIHIQLSGTLTTPPTIKSLLCLVGLDLLGT